ncbi:MAG: hypothetical protein GEEBNDBF_02561 [bacterium]|nr:hypothetical protein [bacterium]
MFRHTLTLAAVATATLGVVACSSGAQGPATPSAAPAPLAPTASQSALGVALQQGSISQSALALYTIDLDPASLTATTTLKSARQGAANDDLYLLSIDSFLTSSSLKVVGIAATPSTIDLTWQLAHPFPAPNNIIGTPNGSTNRADLGIAGQVLFLRDVATATGNTYFGDVIAETSLVTNADAYLQPAGLLALSTTANAFPYQTLIDETAGGTGSRIGISNGGDVTGNFGSDGWTRSEFGATNDGWTGYGVLHQGQRTQRVLSLDRAALTGGFSLDVAVLAKFNDPRGGLTPAQKKANRLPPASADASLFAYRMPHGALDVERIEFLGETGGFLADTISASTLSFRVTDWDARATETAETDLANDASFTNVAQGESGTPALSVDVPGIVSDDFEPTNLADDDSGFGGDVDTDSGRPGDGLFYSRLVTKGAGSGQTPGTYTGLVRATDVEAGLSTPLTIALDGSLSPLTSNQPEPVSYQVFTIDLVSPNLPPTATITAPGAAVDSGNGVLTLTVSAYNDPDADPIQVRFDWNNDGDFADAGESFQTLDGTPPDAFNSPVFYNNATLSTETRTVPYEYTDNINTAISGSVDFTLGANQAPVVTSGSVGLATSSLVQPATFSLSSTLVVTDPEGDTITYSVFANPTSGGAQQATGIAAGALNGYNAAPVMGAWNAVNSPIAFNVRANDPLRPGAAGTLVPTSPFNGTVTAGGCALTMSAVDLALATLTTGSVVRSGVAVQPITGIRLTWTDIAGEAQYGIQRATWTAGATIASVSWATIGTAVANATSYDDTTVNASGNRYLYRVMPRCAIGGPDIATPSQMAMVALQNFESESLAVLNNALPATVLGNDWRLNSATANVAPTVPYSTVSIVDAAGGAISGARGLYIAEVHESSPSNTQGWQAFSPPGLNDRANFPNIGVSRLELNHGGNDFSGTSGYTFLTNASRPTDGLPLPAAPNTWRWVPGPALTGRTYTDNNASSFTTNCFPNITSVAGGSVVSGSTVFHFGDLAAPPAPMHPPGFSAFDASPGTFGSLNHDFIFMCSATADNSRVEGIRYDDIAWIVY